jgi:hypothetical protein
MKTPCGIRACLLFLAAACVGLAGRTQDVGLHPVLFEQGDAQRIEYRSGDELVGCSTDESPAGVQLKLPGGEWTPVRFRTKAHRDGVIELGPTRMGGLTLRRQLVQKTPALVQRTLFDTVRGSAKTETFPVAMLRTADRVFGLAADSPGLWENRCQVLLLHFGPRLRLEAMGQRRFLHGAGPGRPRDDP